METTDKIFFTFPSTEVTHREELTDTFSPTKDNNRLCIPLVNSSRRLL